jgi:hypothetical protein
MLIGMLPPKTHQSAKKSMPVTLVECEFLTEAFSLNAKVVAELVFQNMSGIGSAVGD